MEEKKQSEEFKREFVERQRKWANTWENLKKYFPVILPACIMFWLVAIALYLLLK